MMHLKERSRPTKGENLSCRMVKIKVKFQPFLFCKNNSPYMIDYQKFVIEHRLGPRRCYKNSNLPGIIFKLTKNKIGPRLCSITNFRFYHKNVVILSKFLHFMIIHDVWGIKS